MQLPSIPGVTTLAGLAAFVRDRLGEVAALARREETLEPADPSVVRDLAVLVSGAAAPFAATSYARARLLRQLHASGLLSSRESEQAAQMFGVAQ